MFFKTSYKKEPNMKKLIIATGLLMATSAYAQTEVLTGVTRGKDYGVVYSLPKTQIELEIKANKVSYTPGELVNTQIVICD